MADDGAIFGKIVAGEVPCHKVYEDDRVLAFLDIAPLSVGHTLVIPKRRAATLDEMDAEDAAAIGRVLPRIARAVLRATGCTAFNVLQNNGVAAHQAVGWVHFHVIPKPQQTGRMGGGAGLGIQWPAGRLEPDQAAPLATRVRAAMGEG
jgi:histidine triad (HIT) family protein